MTNEEMEAKLDELYTKFENEKPPLVLDRIEANYNEGFYRGRLNAMARVVKELTGKNGDEINN